MVDLLLHKLSQSKDNADIEKVLDSEKVETEPETLTVKVDSAKTKAGWVGDMPILD